MVLEFRADTSKIMKDLLASGDMTEKDLHTDGHHGELPGPLAERVLGSLPYKQDDEFSLLLIDSLEWRWERLGGLALHNTGDGVDGFAGILGKQGACTTPAGKSWRKLYALAWKGHIKRDINRPARQYGEKERGELEKAFLSLASGYQGKVERVNEVFFHCPDKAGVLLTCSNSENKSEMDLFCLIADRGGWSLVPFVDVPYPVKGGVVFRHADGTGHGGVYMDSELHVVPDLDGDGADEILFTSNTATILYRIVSAQNRAGFSLVIEHSEDYGI
jgi:hypothetical protein